MMISPHWLYGLLRRFLRASSRYFMILRADFGTFFLWFRHSPAGMPDSCRYTPIFLLICLFSIYLLFSFISFDSLLDIIDFLATRYFAFASPYAWYFYLIGLGIAIDADDISRFSLVLKIFRHCIYSMIIMLASFPKVKASPFYLSRECSSLWLLAGSTAAHFSCYIHYYFPQEL